MANKKIVVLKARELIYTAIFLGLGIVLILLLLVMFAGGKKKAAKELDAPKTTEDTNVGDTSTTKQPKEKKAKEESTPTWQPGIYTADFTLSDKTLQVEVLVDSGCVKSVQLIDPSGSTEETDFIQTMYPLVDPAIEVISDNLSMGIALDDITFSQENQYTGSLLKEAVRTALKKAEITP